VRPTWQLDHPAVPWCEVDEWLACVRDNAKDTPFNRLRETMRLACTVLGDGPDIPRLVRIGPMACTIDGQAITIDTLRNLVGALLCEANKVMNNQLLMGLQTAWIRRVIAEGNIVDKVNNFGQIITHKARERMRKRERNGRCCLVSLALPSSAIVVVINDFTTSEDIVLRVKLHGSSSSALNNKRLTRFEHFGENVVRP